MSLVIIVPTKDGVVVAADKRTRDLARGTIDTNQKLHLLLPNGVCFPTGNTGFLQVPTMDMVFDAGKVVDDFYAVHGAVTVASIETMGRTLITAFTAYLSNTHPFHWPENAADGVLFQCPFVFAENGAVALHCIRFYYYRKHAADPCFCQLGTLSSTLPSALGNTSVWDAIIRGDPRIAELRQHELIQRFVLNALPPESVSEADAVMFIDFFFKACSNHFALFADEFVIGPVADIAFIHPTTGFRWIKTSDSKV